MVLTPEESGRRRETNLEKIPLGLFLFGLFTCSLFLLGPSLSPKTHVGDTCQACLVPSFSRLTVSLAGATISRRQAHPQPAIGRPTLLPHEIDTSVLSTAHRMP